MIPTSVNKSGFSLIGLDFFVLWSYNMTSMNELLLKARAVESAVFQCLMNAYNDRSRESYWFKQADKLETKFKNEHQRHYSEVIYGSGNK